jgi:hypothetical protein
VTISIDRPASGRARGPLHHRRVRPRHCGFCCAEVPADAYTDADLSYCNQACYLAHLDELADQEDDGWVDGSPGWDPAQLQRWHDQQQTHQ